VFVVANTNLLFPLGSNPVRLSAWAENASIASIECGATAMISSCAAKAEERCECAARKTTQPIGNHEQRHPFQISVSNPLESHQLAICFCPSQVPCIRVVAMVVFGELYRREWRNQDGNVSRHDENQMFNLIVFKNYSQKTILKKNDITPTLF